MRITPCLITSLCSVGLKRLIALALNNYLVIVKVKITRIFSKDMLQGLLPCCRKSMGLSTYALQNMVADRNRIYGHFMRQLSSASYRDYLKRKKARGRFHERKLSR